MWLFIRPICGDHTANLTSNLDAPVLRVLTCIVKQWSTFLFTLMLLASCRKPEVVPPPASSPPAAKETARVESGNPVETDLTKPGTNQRTGPLPRPEDKKHKAPPARDDVPIAVQVDGRPGFVLSPYNSKAVDVRDIPPGTLVADPTYPPEEKKFFRVP